MLPAQFLPGLVQVDTKRGRHAFVDVLPPPAHAAERADQHDSPFGETLVEIRNKQFFIEGVLDNLDKMLAQYVRAQLLLAFFAFIAYGAFLLIAGLPYALAIAAIAGVLEFIPFIGPLLALGILVSIAFLTGYSHWFVLVGFWAVWRGIQDYINVPRVMGEGLDLHPLLAIFATLVGGEVGGVLGMFLSIPAVAALRILWLNWTRRGLVRTSEVDLELHGTGDSAESLHVR